MAEDKSEIAKESAGKKRRGQKRTFEGVVVSDKMKKMVTVKVETLFKHSQYGKYVRHRKKFMAHDEKGECKVGDKVLIMESRPLSKLKRWRVCKVIERAEM